MSEQYRRALIAERGSVNPSNTARLAAIDAELARLDQEPTTPPPAAPAVVDHVDAPWVVDGPEETGDAQADRDEGADTAVGDEASAAPAGPARAPRGAGRRPSGRRS